MHLLFSLAIFLGAALLFLVQPLCAKRLLPALGGTPGVWLTCMVFFQAGLLAGYAYAHWMARFLTLKWLVSVHMIFFAVALVAAPIAVPRPTDPPEVPAVWLLVTLVWAVGLPFVAMAACGPLLQRWYRSAGAVRDPYFLYAASNLGSFVGLFAYPFVVEPLLTLDEQADWWRGGFVVLAALVLVCGICALGASSPKEFAQQPERRGASGQARLHVLRARWLLLALVPSSLLLSVTGYLTTDIAAIPLLWIMPLGIYLLTFVLAFARRQLVPHAAVTRWLPLVVLVLAILILREGTQPIVLVLGLHLFGFFWLALFCHGELARLRPPAEDLTEFYLWLALGGVLGGMFNALLAPILFGGMVEYPLMIAVACLLRPGRDLALPFDFRGPVVVGLLTLGLIALGRWLDLEPGAVSVAFMFGVPLLLAYVMQNRAYQFGLCIALIFAASLFYPGISGAAVYRQRSFFGVHRVTEQDGYRKLFHGTTLHGQQSLDRKRRHEPLTYYTRSGPIGQVMAALQGDERLKRVGLVGLGAGSLAAFASKGQRWTFFEIDPAVVHIARDTGLFTYLKESRGTIDVVLGDARLTIDRHQDKFGLLVIDAFGSDSIPLHLLTREALRVYDKHLGERGMLALHISNNYVDLEPVLASLAKDAGFECLIQRDGSGVAGKLPSEWAILARRPKDLGALATNGLWQTARPREGVGVWTDDFEPGVGAALARY